MVAQILDGKQIAEKKLLNFTSIVQKKTAEGMLPPKLVVILLGHDVASEIYVRNKQQAAQRIGILSECIHLPTQTPQNVLLDCIHRLNGDDTVHGILVQFPLPAHIHTATIIAAIHPAKDVDGFHPENIGYLAQGQPRLRPCTPMGIMALLDAYAISVAGMDAVVVGASNIVGMPMMLELLRVRATVSVCHRKTHNMKHYIRNAMLLVIAAGSMNCVPADWLLPHHIVVDVGIHRLPDGRLRGDVDFAHARTRTACITPVPGGIGPMTVASLMENTLQAAGFL